MILHDRTEAAQIFVLCRVHLRACFAHSLLSAATIESSTIKSSTIKFNTSRCATVRFGTSRLNPVSGFFFRGMMHHTVQHLKLKWSALALKLALKLTLMLTFLKTLPRRPKTSFRRSKTFYPYYIRKSMGSM